MRVPPQAPASRGPARPTSGRTDGRTGAGGPPRRRPWAAAAAAAVALALLCGHAAAQPAAAEALPRGLSPWGVFLTADSVVRGVMVGLALASLATWTVGIAKAWELWAAGRRVARGLDAVLRAASLGDAARAGSGGPGPAAAMVRCAADELATSEVSLAHAGGAGLRARVASRLGRLEAHAARRAAAGTGLLATVGATAPFVGLFGTVWGIMNSFVGISEARATNLAVVAPGIAEALLATALGLAAAIPAVVIYNALARATAGHRARLADLSAAVERLVSRELDRRLASAGRATEAAG